jgi:hypothetical protein
VFKAIFISAALALCSTAAMAADGGRIFVLRPPVPGKTPGVLPNYAFEQVKQGNGSSGETDPSDNSGGYTFKSAEWDTWTVPITSITVSLSGSEISKKIVVIAPEAMKYSSCRIRDQAGTPYVYAGSFIEDGWGNVGRLTLMPKVVGKLAALVMCEKEVGQSFQVYAERLLISVNP